MASLRLWNATRTRGEIEDFVERVTRSDSADFVAREDRIAVFDNDGTLWPEKPMPIELGFILERLVAMADADPSLRQQQPWKAATEKDYGWLANAITKHYHGDDSDVRTLIGAILRAFEGMDVEEYQASASRFLHQMAHPTLKRGIVQCGYAPMIELLRYLEENGFTTYIASGGDRDFMRVVTEEMYGIPAERVVGSSNALRYIADDSCGSVAYLAKPDVFDDGPAKPVRIWSRTGRRPIFACGNSNGDLQMLQFAGGKHTAFRMLVLHDDPQREFDYSAGAEKALEIAHARGWSVASMKQDWNTVFTSASTTAASRAN
jgi:phosphoserine phosphatase